VNSLIQSFSKGNAIKNGVPVAIIGKPNVGKSTLLNRLLNEEKAIVSEIAGTTRDAIEDTIHIGGIRFRFIDTAGLRSTASVIENLGIRKTHQKIEQSAILLFIADAGDDESSTLKVFEDIRTMVKGKDKQLIFVINKSDLNKSSFSDTEKRLRLTSDEHFIRISAKEGTNVHRLTEILLEASRLGNIDDQGVIISNVRHYEALSHVSESLGRVMKGIAENLPEDLLSQDIREAIHYLGEITGEVTTDEVLGNIFKNFCIGK